jgi:lysophospholipase L1-like esterase
LGAASHGNQLSGVDQRSRPGRRAGSGGVRSARRHRQDIAGGDDAATSGATPSRVDYSQRSATDGAQKSVSCAFTVAVTRPGLLASTKFLAFGDSITAECWRSVAATTGLTPQESFLRNLVMLRTGVNGSTSYPAVLGAQLASRYPTQASVVTNVGLAGEGVTDGTYGTNDVTVARLRSEMAAFSPQIVLLLEGVNDLNSNVTDPEVTIQVVVKGLRDLAREARQRGASQVFIGTLLPQQAGACRARSAGLVASANDHIRTMAAAEQHVLVDVYNGFGGVAGPYIGADGLHPNVSGYEKIAQIFFDAIKTRLEIQHESVRRAWRAARSRDRRLSHDPRQMKSCATSPAPHQCQLRRGSTGFNRCGNRHGGACAGGRIH